VIAAVQFTHRQSRILDDAMRLLCPPQAISEKEKGVADSRNMVQTLVMGMKSLLYSLSSFGNTIQVAFLLSILMQFFFTFLCWENWKAVRASNDDVLPATILENA